MARSSMQRARVAPNPFVPLERTAPDSVLIAFGFRCNLACTFCMVEDVLGQRPGTDLATFRAFAADPNHTRGIRRIVLSGGEATLEPELLAYIAVARSIPGVEHVRIQTNATRLGTGPLLNELIAAGADEFFVSVHGADEPTTAAIAQRPGSFAAIRAGLEAIAASSAQLFTNTCTVQQNFQQLSDIVQLITPLHPAGMDFWNLWPRVDHLAMRAQMVPVTQLQPHLLAALDACAAARIPATVKWFPRCLLGRHAARQDDSQPTTLIDRDYWEAVPAYGCIWAGVCANAQTGCSGLSHAYIETHGWEESALQPQRAEPQASSSQAQHVVDEALLTWTAALDLGVGALLGDWQVASVARHQANVRWVLTWGQTRFTVDVRPRDDRQPAWRRTAFLDISHGQIPDAATQTAPLALPAFLTRLERATAVPDK